MVVPRFFFLTVLDLNLDVLDSKPKTFWHEMYCNNELSQKLDFSRLQGSDFMILSGLGTNCHDFCCPGDWLEIHRISV